MHVSVVGLRQPSGVDRRGINEITICRFIWIGERRDCLLRFLRIGEGIRHVGGNGRRRWQGKGVTRCRGVWARWGMTVNRRRSVGKTGRDGDVWFPLDRHLVMLEHPLVVVLLPVGVCVWVERDVC